MNALPSPELVTDTYPRHGIHGEPWCMPPARSGHVLGDAWACILLCSPSPLSREAGPDASEPSGMIQIEAPSNAIMSNKPLMRTSAASAYLCCKAATTHKPQLLRHLKINFK